MGLEILSTTRGVCPSCRQLVPAQVLLREGQVFLERLCPAHGAAQGLISSDADYYLKSMTVIKPGTLPFAFSTPLASGCPHDCGLCPEHEQHTCLPIIEITDRCDLECPICLVGSGPNPPARPDLTPAEYSGILDALVRAEDELDLINISGGEPTLHPLFRQIVELSLRPEIQRVTVSTNGLALARDESLLDFLQEKGVLISLQMDGFSPEIYRRLRGVDLLAAKEKLLRLLERRKAATSLVVTAAAGLRKDELEPILDYFFGNDHVVSLMFQPLSHTGRCRSLAPDPQRRLTIPDLIGGISAASRGILSPSDFSPLPCSHPACFALTYLLKLEGGGFFPIPRLVSTPDYLDIIQNRALPGLDSESFDKIKDSLYRLWSSSGVAPDSSKILATVKAMLQDLCQSGCLPSSREALAMGERRVKSIFIHHFMDEDSYDLARAVKCCNHYPQRDGRLMPACTFNIFFRHPGQVG